MKQQGIYVRSKIGYNSFQNKQLKNTIYSMQWAWVHSGDAIQTNMISLYQKDVLREREMFEQY